MIERTPNPQEQADSPSHHEARRPPISPAPTQPDPAKPASAKPDETFAPQGQFAIEALLNSVYAKKKSRPPFSGKRHQGEKNRIDGPAVGTTKAIGSAADISVAATLRASGLRRSVSGRDSLDGGSSGRGNFPNTELPDSKQLPISGADRLAGVSNARILSKEDLRFKVRQAKAGTLILFVVDSSGSMGARKRMGLVKGAVLNLLGDAYRKRDRVGLISFRGPGASVLVPPTNSVELAEQKLRQLPTGGKTPLAAGLQLADQLLESQLRRVPGLVPLLIVVTDGRGNIGPPPIDSAMELVKKGYPALVLDSEQGYVRLGDAQRLAHELNAVYAPLDQLAEFIKTLR